MFLQLKKGLLTGIGIHGVFLLLSLICYIYIPQKGHMPGIHFLILIGLFYISLFWSFFNMILVFYEKTQKFGLGMLITNIVYIISCLIFVLSANYM